MEMSRLSARYDEDSSRTRESMGVSVAREDERSKDTGGRRR